MNGLYMAQILSFFVEEVFSILIIQKRLNFKQCLYSASGAQRLHYELDWIVKADKAYQVYTPWNELAMTLGL